MGGSGPVKEVDRIGGEPGGHWGREMQFRGIWEPL